MNVSISRNLLFSVLVLLLSALWVGADEAEQKGLAIAREADRRDQGFGDFSARLTMTLHDRQGRESVRSLRNRTLEQPEDGDKTLVIFDEPSDVKGTALLIFSHKTGDDDLWLYLPALKRVKRISGSNKSGPFMGSEFAYEDLSSAEVEKYTYRWLGEETLEGEKAFMIERVPVDPKSGYVRQVVWIDQEYRTLKIDFYDRKGALLKTLTQSGFERLLDRYWRPTRLTMVNHQNGKRSELLWTDMKLRSGLDARDFDQASLERIR